MTQTTTLAHISDVHLAPLAGFHPRYWNLKRGLGYLNWHRGRVSVHLRDVADAIAADAVAQKPDHIAVTGDLANIGLPSEYEAALSWLKALGDPGQVSVVPGNHDIYTARLHGASCLERWAPYMASDAWGAKLAAAAKRRISLRPPRRRCRARRSQLGGADAALCRLRQIGRAPAWRARKHARAAWQ